MKRRDISSSGRRRRAGSRLSALAVAALAVLIWTVPLSGQTSAPTGKGAIVPIRGEITDVLRDSIERRVEQARTDGATVIIFELDTPGGMVTSALDICRMIKKLPSDVRSVAWVHDEAYSAGAMISVACQQILMSSNSTMGDCTPIMMGPGGVQEMSDRITAKAESPVLQEFRDSAQRNNYDLLLCRAMVKVDEEVWWLEQVETGQRKFVDGPEKKKLFDDVPEDERQYRLAEEFTDYMGQTKPVRQPIDRVDSVLTVSQSEAVAFGLAAGIAADGDDLAEHLRLAAPPVYHAISGWEKFAMWLNSPLVRGVLFMIMIVGAYLEYQSPGLIIPGAVALLALVVFLGAPYIAGLADIWTIVLLVIGLILLALEILVIPGFGIAGILGIALILIAFIGTFVPAEPEAPPLPFHWPDLQGTWDALKTGVIVLASSMVIAVIGIMLLARYLPEMPVAKRIILTGQDAAALALSEPSPDIAQMGDIGVVVGDLKPSGRARFGSEVVDVQSQGEYVDAGQRVQVLRREGRNIIVRPLPEQA